MKDNDQAADVRNMLKGVCSEPMLAVTPTMSTTPTKATTPAKARGRKAVDGKAGPSPLLQARVAQDPSQARPEAAARMARRKQGGSSAKPERGR